MSIGISIRTNLAAIRSQRLLNEVGNEHSSSLERLSSGQRINRPSDDAASLSIASKLSANRRVYSQGVRNISDGLSALSIAEAAVEQLSTIVTRLAELAGQSANGAFSFSQRKALQAEASALSDEYTRLVDSTSFNGRQLLLERAGIRIQGGFGVDGSIATSVGGARATGSFRSAATSLTGSDESMSAAARDINGDGIADLVALSQLGADIGFTVQLGQGDGSFGGATSYVLATATGDVGNIQLVDLNNDGNLDVVAAAGQRIYTAFGGGDGGFAEAESLAVSVTAGFRRFDVGDVNNDGLPDIVVAAGGIQTFLNGGGGSFGAAIQTNATGFSAQRIRLADTNNDGVLDIITTGELEQSVMIGDETGGLLVLNGNGSGSYTQSFVRDLGSAGVFNPNLPFDFAVGDLNNDGNVDIILSASDSFGDIRTSILSGNGSTFSVQTANAPLSLAAIAELTTFELVDLNDDGILDIVATADATSLQIRLGNGDFTFEQNSFGGTPPLLFRSFAFADVNQDGALDLLVAGAGASGGEVATFQAETQAGVSRLLDFSLLSVGEARQALSLFAYTLNNLSKQRGEIGAYQSRLSTAASTLSSSIVELAASEARLTDVDFAGESARLVRLQTLRNAGAAVLAQANQQPEIVLGLLAVS